MRRVYDDIMLTDIAPRMIQALIDCKNTRNLCKYDYGSMRAQTSKIKDLMVNSVEYVMIGANANHTSIGNNWCHELIYTGNATEQQIFGLLHITNDMYGSCIVWISDIDGNKITPSYTVNDHGVRFFLGK